MFPSSAAGIETCFRRVRRCFVSVFLLLLAGGGARGAEPIRYIIDLREPASHLVQVTMKVTGSAAPVEIQFPAWNALYQMRDFVTNVQDLEATCDGQRATLTRLDLNTWRGPTQACGDLEFRYAVFANEDSPFSSMLNSNHSFLNLAMVFFYLPKERDRPAHVKILHREDWQVATLLPVDGDEIRARDYDALVDSPIEAGQFVVYTYAQDYRVPGGTSDGATKRATFRIIVHADLGDYSPDHLLDLFPKITAAETSMMQDLPFDEYTFILHFSRDGGQSGGMEHRDGAAISFPASLARAQNPYLEEVVAHELFHAWNVKRIRPQSLEPVDYIHGNDTRDLWLFEGVTSMYGELVLLRAGLIDRDTLYARLADAIQTLEARSARRVQSAETSGQEAWFEKYSNYNRPDRSISYYNKGEILGFLLDLGIRNASRNQASLDDVMRRLNRNFAQRGRLITLTDVRTAIIVLAPSFAVEPFFSEYVQGTAELDYATYLGYGGLRMVPHTALLASPGFSAAINSAGLLAVESVEQGSDAQRAGLRPGDVLLEADNEPLIATSDSSLPQWKPGQAVAIQIARSGATSVLRFHVGVTQQVSFQIVEDLTARAQQLRVREGLLKGTTTSTPISGKP